ncbi:hypothetical protein FOCC_FOCC009280 [Frankliniella occidentalis]|nr:hypothetical protein FOCC_FOCC009280 [Frankliniella occidentalis]
MWQLLRSGTVKHVGLSPLAGRPCSRLLLYARHRFLDVTHSPARSVQGQLSISGKVLCCRTSLFWFAAVPPSLQDVTMEERGRTLRCKVEVREHMTCWKSGGRKSGLLQVKAPQARPSGRDRASRTGGEGGGYQARYSVLVVGRR